MADLEQAYGTAPGLLAATAFAPARLTPAITGRQVVIVTNATTRLESDVDRLGSARHVDAIVAG